MSKELYRSESYLIVKSTLSSHLQFFCFMILAVFFLIHITDKGALSDFKDSMGIIVAANFALLALVFHYFSYYVHHRSVYYHVLRLNLEDHETLYSYQRIHTLEDLADRIDRCYKVFRFSHFFEHLFFIIAIFCFIISFSILSFGHLMPELMAKKFVVIPMGCSQS